jgi:hypothetical protein
MCRFLADLYAWALQIFTRQRLCTPAGWQDRNDDHSDPAAGRTKLRCSRRTIDPETRACKIETGISRLNIVPDRRHRRHTGINGQAASAPGAMLIYRNYEVSNSTYQEADAFIAYGRASA